MRLPVCLIAALCAGWAMAEDGTPPTAAEDTPTASGDWPSLVHQGLTYPYQREPGSYLFVDGAVYPYMHITDQLLGDSTVRLPNRSEISVSQLLASLGLAQLVGEHLEPAIGYGSNPAPSQLARKYAAQSATGHAVIPVIKGRLSDYDVVWTPVFVGYGAMPATITPSPGTEVDVWITWLPDQLVKLMSESEHAGKAGSDSQSLYAFATLENAHYAFDGPDPDKLKAYVSCFGALSIDGEILAVASVPALGRNFRAIDSAEALSAVASAIGWRGSVLDLLYANISEPQERAGRSDKLRPLGVIADDPNLTGMEACKGSRSGPEKPF